MGGLPEFQPSDSKASFLLKEKDFMLSYLLKNLQKNLCLENWSPLKSIPVKFPHLYFSSEKSIAVSLTWQVWHSGH